MFERPYTLVVLDGLERESSVAQLLAFGILISDCIIERSFEESLKIYRKHLIYTFGMYLELKASSVCIFT